LSVMECVIFMVSKSKIVEPTLLLKKDVEDAMSSVAMTE